MKRTLHDSRLRSARGTLLWGCAGFLALQLGLAIGIERWFPEFQHPCYGVKAGRLRQRLVSGDDKPLCIVMLGSSRTTFGFRGAVAEEVLGAAGMEWDCPNPSKNSAWVAPDVERVTKQASPIRPVVAFNFGILGAGPVTELLALRRLLREGLRPDGLLIEVMPPFLSDQPEMIEANRMPVTVDCLRREEVGLLNHYGAEGRGLLGDWWLSWPVPWYSHRFSIMSKVAANWLPYAVRQDQFRGIDSSGWVDLLPCGLTPDEHHRRAEAERRSCEPCLKSYRLNPLLCQALDDLLALCRQEQIPTTLVLMPEAQAFRALYSPGGRQELETFVKALRQAHAVGVVDAREWMADDDFIDSDHLHPAGASLFSERLGRECLVPLVAMLRRTREER